MKYDVVIVGGGAAGSVLASRLAENANTSVLLVEEPQPLDSLAGGVFVGRQREMVRPQIRPLPDAARQDLLTELNVSLSGVHSHPCHPPPTKGKALQRELYAFYLGLSRSSGGNPARNTRDSSGITS